MTDYFLDAKIIFRDPSLWGIGIALVFGTFWIVLLAPRQAARPTFWVMFLLGALAFVPAIAWVQSPLQTLLGQGLTRLWTMEQLQERVLLAVVPQILIGGLVQEGLKFIPLAIWFFAVRRGVAGPKSSLILGAALGAGFAIVEGQWVLNTLFAQGFTWETLQIGWDAYLPFIERFFIMGFGVAAGGLMAWGLARRLGWQSYLVASVLHGAINYGAVLYQLGRLSVIQVEVGIAVFSTAFFCLIAFLRWRKSDGDLPGPVVEAAPPAGQSDLPAATQTGVTNG